MSETTEDTSPSNPQAYADHTLRNGGRAHRLTPEEARKGALRSAEKKREAKRRASMTLNEHIAERLEKEASEIIEGFIAAGREGDWRAYDSLMDRYLGKATQRVETSDATAQNPWDALTEEGKEAHIQAARARLRALEGGKEAASG